MKDMEDNMWKLDLSNWNNKAALENVSWQIKILLCRSESFLVKSSS